RQTRGFHPTRDVGVCPQLPRHARCTRPARSWSRRRENCLQPTPSVVECPCLYSAIAPICRADTESMRIRPAGQLDRCCLTERQRRCDFFPRFLCMFTERPEKWRAQGGRRERTVGESASPAQGVPALKP